MVLCIQTFCTVLFIVFQSLRSQPIRKSQTVTPAIPKVNGFIRVNGATLITHYKEVTRFNNSWHVSILSQNSWQFILSLDSSWGFDPLIYSSIKITINSPSIATGPSTFDWLIFGFTSDNQEYISTLIPMENVEHNRIYPGCDTTDIPSMFHGVGDIASLPDFDRSCDVANGLCTNWQDILPVNLPTQRNGFPISFQFENDPRSNILKVTFSTDNYLGGFQQQCGFVASPTNSGLKLYFGGNDPGQTFIVSSFEIAAWSQTDSPTKSPTSEPTNFPSKPPTKQPTLSPSTDPTNVPTNAPSNAPTLAPSAAPSFAPSIAPTPAPTNDPTPAPTNDPTLAPSMAPILPPTNAPSLAPSIAPTPAPTDDPTPAPTNDPTLSPSSAPIMSPTDNPTAAPTDNPSAAPTQPPTSAPSMSPVKAPSAAPSMIPTRTPTSAPTSPPTNAPTLSPVLAPTNAPTLPPTSAPSTSPTPAPSNMPTVDPTIDPTSDPTLDPTIDPTLDPTLDPTIDPTADPTIDPTNDPTLDPTIDPTIDPTADPSVDPTSDPTLDPTQNPTHNPTADPTTEPKDVDSSVLAASAGGFGQFVIPITATASVLILFVLIRILFGCYKNRNSKNDMNKLSFVHIIAPTPQLKAVKSESPIPLIDTYLITVHFERYHFRYVLHKDSEERDGIHGTGFNADDFGWDETTYYNLRTAIEQEFGLEFTEFRLYEHVGDDRVLIEDIDDIIAGFDSTHNIRTSERSMAMDIFVQIVDNRIEGNTTGGNNLAKESFTGISNMTESGDVTNALLMSSAVHKSSSSMESSSNDSHVLVTPGNIARSYKGIDGLDEDLRGKMIRNMQHSATINESSVNNNSRTSDWNSGTNGCNNSKSSIDSSACASSSDDDISTTAM